MHMSYLLVALDNDRMKDVKKNKKSIIMKILNYFVFRKLLFKEKNFV